MLGWNGFLVRDVEEDWLHAGQDSTAEKSAALLERASCGGPHAVRSRAARAITPGDREHHELVGRLLIYALDIANDVVSIFGEPDDREEETNDTSKSVQIL